MIRPGEIYVADLPEGVGKHPIIVVSREELNRGDVVSAVVVTSAKFAVRSKLPNCVPFQAGQFGFTSNCVAQCETMNPIPLDLIDVANGPTGVLDDATLRDVIKAIGHVIEADCEPA